MGADQATAMATRPEHHQVVDRLTKRFDHQDPQLSPDVLNDVYRGLLDGPAIHQSDVHGGVAYLTRYDDVVAVEKNTQVFSSAQGVRCPRQANQPLSIPAETDKPMHTEYRRLFLNVLSPPQVRKAEPFLRELTEALVRDYVAGPQDDFCQNVATQLPIRAVGELIGLDLHSSGEMQKHVEALLLHYGKPEALQALNGLTQIAQVEIDARRANPRDDYLTALTTAKVDGRLLTDEELQNMMRTFMFAGFETTAHMIGSMMLYLAEHPDVQKRVREDDQALINCVEECLRFLPPVQTMFRTVTTSTCLRDVELAQGDTVGLLYAAANRDAAKFENPDAFDIDRSNARLHLSFGFGQHLCAGSHLARREMHILLEVLRDYPPFTLGGPVTMLPHLMGGQMMGPEHLPISFKTTEERA
ncbi:MAG: cytochrome P450 [Blastomonas sp.]